MEPYVEGSTPYFLYLLCTVISGFPTTVHASIGLSLIQVQGRNFGSVQICFGFLGSSMKFWRKGRYKDKLKIKIFLFCSRENEPPKFRFWQKGNSLSSQLEHVSRALQSLPSSVTNGNGRTRELPDANTGPGCWTLYSVILRSSWSKVGLRFK